MRRAIGFFEDTANLLHKGKQPNVQKFLCAHAFPTRTNERVPFFLCNLISVRHVAPTTVAIKQTVQTASLTSYRIGARARAEHRQSGRQRDKAACRLSLREADAEAACQDFGNCHHRLEPIARSSLVSGKPAMSKIHLLVVLANPHCVCPLLNMPAWLCPRPPANRETAATEMVQPAEQQQQ